MFGQLHCLESCLAIEEEARRLEPASLRGYQLYEGNPVADFMAGLTSPMPTAQGGVSILELLAAIARCAPPQHSTAALGHMARQSPACD